MRTPAVLFAFALSVGAVSQECSPYVTSIMTDKAEERELDVRRPILKREAEKDAACERGSFEKKGSSSDKDAAVI